MLPVFNPKRKKKQAKEATAASAILSWNISEKNFDFLTLLIWIIVFFFSCIVLFIVNNKCLALFFFCFKCINSDFYHWPCFYSRMYLLRQSIKVVIPLVFIFLFCLINFIKLLIPSSFLIIINIVLQTHFKLTIIIVLSPVDVEFPPVGEPIRSPKKRHVTFWRVTPLQ